jgi:hypothetical protein
MVKGRKPRVYRVVEFGRWGRLDHSGWSNGRVLGAREIGVPVAVVEARVVR